MKTQAFDGRICFETTHVSLGVFAEMQAIEETIRVLEPKLVKDYPGIVNELSSMLVLTTSITFNFRDDETDMLKQFRDFWIQFDEMRGNRKTSIDERIRPALEWRKNAGMPVVKAWNDAVDAPQVPFVNPVQAPESALTTEQREELKDPDSPLVDGAATTDSPSEIGQTSTSNPSET